MKKILFLAIFALAMAGCAEEKDLTPSEGLEKWVYNRQSVFDQWAPYPELQARVLDFFDKTGTMILIDFDADKDVWWAPTSITPRVNRDDVTKVQNGCRELRPVDKSNGGEYLKKQLDLLQDEVFDYFTVEEMKNNMPQYIFLTDIVATVNVAVGGAETWIRDHVYAGSTGNYFVFSWGGPDIDAITAADRLALRADAAGSMLGRMAPGDKTAVSAFYAVTTAAPSAMANAYTAGTMGIAGAYIVEPLNPMMPSMGHSAARDYKKLYTAGIVSVAPSTLYDVAVMYMSQNFATATTNAANNSSLYCVVNRDIDWSSYVTMILNNSYAELTAQPDAWPAAKPYYKLPSYKGIMSSTVMGVNAKIRKKYDIVIDYYKRETGINIQDFGDGTKRANQ